MRKLTSLWLFLIGLGSHTQFHLVGSLGISELPIYLFAPFIFIREYRILKKDGFLPFVWITIFTCCGCLLGARINGAPSVFVMKGVAFPYAIFASIVIYHSLLRKNFNEIKWYLVGSFLSSIVCVFIFQPEVHTVRNGMVATGDAAVAAMMGYALFWTSRIRSLICLPVSAFYLSTPRFYAVIAPLLSAGIYIAFSHGSGRASAVVSIGTAFLIYMGAIGRHFFSFILLAVVLLALIKISYSWSARNGILGDVAREKYLHQTRKGSSVINILMSGRMEFFCGLMAAIDKPIIGHGPKAEDKNGYVERYLSRYGTDDDLKNYIGEMELAAKRGQGGFRFIPMHSYIVSFWVQYGIFGLILWLYVLYLAFMYFRKYAPMIPQWYGYLCLGICNLMWDVLFSPFSSRLGVPFMVCCILFAKALYERRIQLPYNMEMEIYRIKR